MSKRFKRPPINFQDFLDRKEVEDSIPVELGGRVFVIRPAHLLNDDEFRRLVATEDPEEVARITMRDYDDFVAAGGSAAGLMALMEEEQKRREAEAAQGADAGESGASSSS